MLMNTYAAAGLRRRPLMERLPAAEDRHHSLAARRSCRCYAWMDDEVEAETLVCSSAARATRPSSAATRESRPTRAGQVAVAVWSRLKVSKSQWSTVCISSRFAVYNQGSEAAVDGQE